MKIYSIDRYSQEFDSTFVYGYVFDEELAKMIVAQFTVFPWKLSYREVKTNEQLSFAIRKMAGQIE